MKGFVVDVVNGFYDHCHCLVNLDANQSIAKVVNLIKGESSYWINRRNLVGRKFEWQDEYFAAAVSGAYVDRVRDYIMNQEQHHQKRQFQEEFDKLVILCTKKSD